MQGRRVRIALVGCGRIAATHVKAIAQQVASAELVALCDVDPSAMTRLQATWQAAGHTAPLACFDSLTALLAQSDADLVVLATPSGLHAQQAMQVAAAGRHVLSEKPMATRWQDALAMVHACDTAGVRLFIVKQNRLNPTLVKLKTAIDDGRFGRLAMITVNVFWTRPQSYYDAAPWRGTWALDGGAFMNQASHYVDLVTWLAGPVQQVHAFTATLARQIEAEDTGVMSLRMASGALATINVTMLTHDRNLEGSITVLGEQGTVRVGGVAVNRIEHWQFATSTAEDALMQRVSYEAPSVYGPGHAGLYAQVLASLRGEAAAHDPAPVDGHESLQSLELLIAAYRSAAQGVTVALPLSRDVAREVLPHGLRDQELRP
jgi:UDP-N-acetyl-2-amino-2-deoxyglucuronate dehydrogenase